jgi:methylmalonyl-CoA mutase
VHHVAPDLKAAGARTVMLAGFPAGNKEAWEAAGVDRFVYVGCNALETLRELLREEGVLST